MKHSWFIFFTHVRTSNPLILWLDMFLLPPSSALGFERSARKLSSDRQPSLL